MGLPLAFVIQKKLQSAGEVLGALPLLKGAGREALASVIRRKGN